LPRIKNTANEENNMVNIEGKISRKNQTLFVGFCDIIASPIDIDKVQHL
jgi:hypothetical protein